VQRKRGGLLALKLAQPRQQPGVAGVVGVVRARLVVAVGQERLAVGSGDVRRELRTKRKQRIKLNRNTVKVSKSQ